MYVVVRRVAQRWVESWLSLVWLVSRRRWSVVVCAIVVRGQLLVSRHCTVVGQSSLISRRWSVV